MPAPAARSHDFGHTPNPPPLPHTPPRTHTHLPQANIGALVGKTLTTTSVGGIVYRPGGGPPVALDVFSIQARVAVLGFCIVSRPFARVTWGLDPRLLEPWTNVCLCLPLPPSAIRHAADRARMPTCRPAPAI